MEVIDGLENVVREPDGALSVGSFDGLHLGHQRIIRLMKRSGLGPISVITFAPHPQVILRPGEPPPPQLTTFEERLALFSAAGVDRLLVVKFDRDFAAMTAERFVDDVLVGAIGLKGIFVGPRHGFGAGRRGNVELLQSMGNRLGFSAVVVPSVIREKLPISSSRIRKTLLAGDATRSMKWLGRPYFVIGKVVRGDGRGRKLGFPTANLESDDPLKLTPLPGIYATVAEFRGCRFASVSHIGERPTFPGAAPAIETHIDGIDEELYGEHIHLGLVRRLRGIVAFGSAKELVVQMKQDLADAHETLSAMGYQIQAKRQSRRLGAMTVQ